MAVALLALLALAAPARAETARPAADFTGSVGVNVHTTWNHSAYADYADVLGAFRQVGIRHARDGLISDVADPWAAQRQHTYFDALAAAGVRMDLILAKPGTDDLGRLVATLRDRLPKVVESVEGPNELDLSGRADWAAALRDYQQRLYTSVRAQPALDAVSVIGPSFGRINNMIVAGDLRASTDAVNLHPYPNGTTAQASSMLDNWLAIAAAMSGNKPVVATETGFHNALCDATGHLPVSERAAGVLVPRILLDHFRRGIARSYLYELVDNGPDAHGCSREKHFGLFRNDFTPKPAATSLARLMRVLGGADQAARAEQLDVGLSGGGAELQHLLLQRADGAFALVLWRQVDVWDYKGRRDVTPPPATVRVALPGATARTVTQIVKGTERAAAGGALDVEVPGDDITVVSIARSASEHPAPASPPVPPAVLGPASPQAAGTAVAPTSDRPVGSAVAVGGIGRAQPMVCGGPGKRKRHVVRRCGRARSKKRHSARRDVPGSRGRAARRTSLLRP